MLTNLWWCKCVIVKTLVLCVPKIMIMNGAFKANIQKNSRPILIFFWIKLFLFVWSSMISLFIPELIYPLRISITHILILTSLNSCWMKIYLIKTHQDNTKCILYITSCTQEVNYRSVFQKNFYRKLIKWSHK